MAKKSKNQKFIFNKTSIVIFIVISLVLTALTFIFKTNIESFLNKNSLTDVIDDNGLVMHTIDVGQAEAIMIKLPDGKNMLVDSGEKGKTNTERLKGYLLNNYFSNLENKEIDYFLLTHSDSDHSGGAPMIFDTFKVNKVFRPNLFSTLVESDEAKNAASRAQKVESAIWGETITKMYAEEDCEIVFSRAGIEIIEEEYSIKFLSPNVEEYDDVNSYSPLVVIEYENRRIMLTGDATLETEELAINNLIKCDILKVAHHGSKTSTGAEFLEKVKPNYAIISCNNEGNNYGHPHQEVLNRLLNYVQEKNIFRTDINGNILTNITESGEILFALDVKSSGAYIKAEYVLVGTIGVLFVVCFSINFSKKRKIS